MQLCIVLRGHSCRGGCSNACISFWICPILAVRPRVSLLLCVRAACFSPVVSSFLGHCRHEVISPHRYSSTWLCSDAQEQVTSSTFGDNDVSPTQAPSESHWVTFDVTPGHGASDFCVFRALWEVTFTLQLNSRLGLSLSKGISSDGWESLKGLQKSPWSCGH